MTTVDFIAQRCSMRSMSRWALSPNIPRPTSGPVKWSLRAVACPQRRGNRPFYRWLSRDYRALFPRLPERTRLFRP